MGDQEAPASATPRGRLIAMHERLVDLGRQLAPELLQEARNHLANKYKDADVNIEDLIAPEVHSHLGIPVCLLRYPDSLAACGNWSTCERCKHTGLEDTPNRKCPKAECNGDWQYDWEQAGHSYFYPPVEKTMRKLLSQLRTLEL